MPSEKQLSLDLVRYGKEADELKQAILRNEGDLNKNLYDLYNYALITPLRESIFEFLDDLLEQEESKHNPGTPLSRLYGKAALSRFDIVSTKGLKEEVPKTKTYLQKAFDHGVEGMPLETVQKSFQKCLQGMDWLAGLPSSKPT